MAEIDTNYYMKKGESASAYNTRVAEYNASKNKNSSTGTTAPTPTTQQDPFMKTLQEKLMSQSEIISSGATNIENKINEAIGGLQKSTQLGSAAIESAYTRQKSYNEDTAKMNFQAFRESQSGFGTQMVALRNLVQTTDKEMKDLDMRKNELIMQNDAAGAAKIAELQLKALVFQEDAKQKTFTNLLSMSNFGLSAAQFEEGKRQFGVEQGFAERQQSFTEKSALANIAMEFGIQVQEGDTIDDVVNRAMPYASEKRQLEMQAMREDIKNKQASTAKILKGEVDEQAFDPETIEVLARAAMSGDTFFIEALKTNEQKKSVYKAIADQKEADKNNLSLIAEESTTPEEFRTNAEFYYNSINYPMDEGALAQVIAATDFSKTSAKTREEQNKNKRKEETLKKFRQQFGGSNIF